MSDDMCYRLPDGTAITFSQFLTLCCERRAAEAKAEAALRAVAQQLIDEEQGK